MPRRTWTAKDERQYKKILRSCKKRKGRAKGATKVCERIAAATVNKSRQPVKRRRALRGLGTAVTRAMCLPLPRLSIDEYTRLSPADKRAYMARLNDPDCKLIESRAEDPRSADAYREADEYYRMEPVAQRAWLKRKYGTKGLGGTVRKISVDRERLDRGGYTSSGRYFGVGDPLYTWWHEASGEGGHVRAKNAKEARAKVQAEIAQRESRYDYTKDIDYDPARGRIVRAKYGLSGGWEGAKGLGAGRKRGARFEHAYDNGNYANAYQEETPDDAALAQMDSEQRAGYLLGFFSSYSMYEVPYDYLDEVNQLREEYGDED